MFFWSDDSLCNENLKEGISQVPKLNICRCSVERGIRFGGVKFVYYNIIIMLQIRKKENPDVIWGVCKMIAWKFR